VLRRIDVDGLLPAPVDRSVGLVVPCEIDSPEGYGTPYGALPEPGSNLASFPGDDLDFPDIEGDYLHRRSANGRELLSFHFETDR
jgi:hypothetical protein